MHRAFFIIFIVLCCLTLSPPDSGVLGPIMVSPAYAKKELSPTEFAAMQDKKLREQGKMVGETQKTNKTKSKSLRGLGIMAGFLIAGGLGWYWFRKNMSE